MAYTQKNNPFKKIIKQKGMEEGEMVKTKTKIDKDGNVVWTKTKKKGQLRYKKDKPKTETPPDPFGGKLNVKPTDPGKTHQA